MARLGYQHIGTEYASEQQFELIPQGWYLAQIIGSEIVETDTDKGQGQMLKLKYQIIDDKYHGRIVFQQMMISHVSQEAERIGRQQLDHIVKACGLDDIEDSEELHSIPFLARIGIDKGKPKPGGGNYDDRNTVKGAKPSEDNNRKAAQPDKFASHRATQGTERRRELSSDELAEQEIGNARLAKAQQAAAQQNSASRTQRRTPFA